jgi:ribonuclease HI
LNNQIIIFTDGAAKGNPGPAGWGTIVRDLAGSVLELGGAAALATNNQMEMTAVIEGLRTIVSLDGDALILSDSQYVLNGIQKWVYGWRRNGWVTSGGGQVANRELWEEMMNLLEKRRGRGKIEWRYVRGHVGTPGNERVDRIASDLAEGKHVDLYSGPESGYGVDLSILPAPEEPGAVRRKDAYTSTQKKSVYYLSLVGGVLETHKTWQECERRVKGRSGVLFKKVSNQLELNDTLLKWGVNGPVPELFK